MYFFGTYFYVSTMVNDVAAALNGLDKSYGDQPIERMHRIGIQQALVNEIRFHYEILEYGISDNFRAILTAFNAKKKAHTNWVNSCIARH